MEVKSFTIYKEYYDLITLLPEKEQKDLILAIFKYMFEDIEPTLNNKQNKIFINLKRPLDVSKIRGKVGSKNKSNENQNKIKIKSNENQKEITSNDVYVNVNVNVNNNKIIKEIIEYLNLKTNKHFKYNSNNTIKHIKARLNEGYKLEDFKKVIDIKTNEWLNDKKMNQYLCPDTLFGTKFEKYLNQQIKKPTLKDIVPMIDYKDFLEKGAKKSE